MALFALWRAHRSAPEPLRATHRRVAAAAHVDPELVIARPVETRNARWHLSAFATTTSFYPAERQLWFDPEGGVCVIHGLLWRANDRRPAPLDAEAVAALLPTPGAVLPDDIAGEYAVARLHRGGELCAFADPAGLHQIFVGGRQADVVANRAGLVAALAPGEADGAAGAWITTIGYRVGTAVAQGGVRQLASDQMLAGGAIRPRPGAVTLPQGPRGFANGGAALLDQGIAQAQAAVVLAAGDGLIDLPVTGGKDSRAVLALCLGAGLRDRIQGFTRGYPHSPDAVAGAGLAAAAGIPHRREPPLGSDAPADMDLDAFHLAFARLAFQTDGNMGGWDMITGTRAGTDTLVTGHLGELLKAYAKHPLPPTLDPVTMVRLQAPFDPLGILRNDARARMVDALAAEMDRDRASGAEEADLPDLFYLRHRIPNWLGGIRGVKSFERQPVLPLGVPALAALALRMTAGERRIELAHYRMVERCAPALLAPPFAHQRWDIGLPGAPQVDPVLVPAGQPLFGNWQYSINSRPEIRAHLIQLFERVDLPIWGWIDRSIVIDRLRHRRIDYFEGISLLGLVVSVYHAAGLLLTERLRAPDAGQLPVSAPPPPFTGAALAMGW